MAITTNFLVASTKFFSSTVTIVVITLYSKLVGTNNHYLHDIIILYRVPIVYIT